MSDEKKAEQPLKQIKVKGTNLIEKIKEIIEDGNARKVIIKKDNRTIMEFPLTIGVGGAAAAVFFAPQMAAIGTIAALVSDVEVELVPREAEWEPVEDAEIVDEESSSDKAE